MSTSSADVVDSPQSPPSVFLSYASEDRPAARSIRDALAGFGIEVWYDENELDGGDAWDQKIRRQIRECDYFMPLVSATTEARPEGYFRREWRLAVERTLDMADDHTFLLPVVIDKTSEAGARVPEKFLAVQWLKAPGGQSTPALEALCRRIVSGKTTGPQPPRKAPARPSGPGSKPPPRSFPEFPREEPGQRIRFGVDVIGWAFRSAWIFFMRWPRWVRVIVCIWLSLTLSARACQDVRQHPHAATLSSARAKKLKEISDEYQGSSNPADIAKLSRQIAREFSEDIDEDTAREPLLAIPFTAPTADPAAAKLANSSFAQAYGRIAMSQHGHVALSQEPLPSLDLATAVKRGEVSHSTYVLCGAIDTQGSAQVLTVKIVAVADGSVLWSESYPATGADPTKIAAEVAAKVPPLGDD
jgi:TolB-like protein